MSNKHIKDNYIAMDWDGRVFTYMGEPKFDELKGKFFDTWVYDGEPERKAARRIYEPCVPYWLKPGMVSKTSWNSNNNKTGGCAYINYFRPNQKEQIWYNTSTPKESDAVDGHVIVKHGMFFKFFKWREVVLGTPWRRIPNGLLDCDLEFITCFNCVHSASQKDARVCWLPKEFYPLYGTSDI